MQDRSRVGFQEELSQSDLIDIVLKAMAITGRNADVKPNKIHERSRMSVAILTDRPLGHRIDLPGRFSLVVQVKKHLDGAGHRR